jgi:GNAT superfamily N-acetyltransferase
VEPRPIARDLAPGDQWAAAFDWQDYSVRRVTGPNDPDFRPAFERLWNEFGARGEMERDTAIAERLAWTPGVPIGDFALQYELLVVRRGDEIVAVRDHTAVVDLKTGGPTVVHLSHVLVAPPDRGSGLAAWLRALPLQVARTCAAAVGRPAGHPIVLVAEMEPPDPTDAARTVRLRSYERAGFRKLDPSVASYAQPDFRPATVLGAEPPAAIPLVLIVRRVGPEDEPAMPAAEVEAVVAAIYGVYAVHLAAPAVAQVQAAAAVWTRRQASFSLLPPTS